ncbi:MAG: hypothetical protein OEW37_07790 [Rhodospirillaceae bacterium]|nr:hypothetical protein [Rhodospirillaceae bacterium]
MSILATTLIPALLPAVGDAVRGLVAKFTGSAGGKPQNVDEAIKLVDADIRRLEALTKLDAPSGNASKWVINLRESSRYIAVFVVLLTWVYVTAQGNNEPLILLAAELAQSAFFFLFGDRVYINLKKRASLN